MNKNLPITKKNTELTLSKTRSLINVTSKILSNKKKFEGLIDNDSWVDRLLAWADENTVPTQKRSRFITTELPRNKIELVKLTSLSFSYIKFLPKEIENFTNLPSLSLSYSRLTELPKEIGSLIHLTYLGLNNLLSEGLVLSKEIGNLTNLTTLLLHGSGLTELPKEISNLTNLTTLSLHTNELTELSKEIGNLTNLTELDLNETKLTELPKEIGNLTKLKKLYLNYNNLRTLPNEIINLTNLTALNLDENPNLILTQEQKDWILSLENAVEDIYSYNDDNYYINYDYDLLDRNA